MSKPDTNPYEKLEEQIRWNNYLKEKVEEYIQEPELVEYLRTYVSPSKQELFAKILDNRTKHITVVLENFYQAQNASAVLRSADCFGLSDIHVIEETCRYQLNPKVVKGAAKWVGIHRYDQGKDAFASLKKKGYKIVTTTPHTDMELDDLPIDEPLALVFGNEKDGVENATEEIADYKIRIPMYGFTESFNVSVSAAITLNHLVTKLHKSEIDWRLSSAERKMTDIEWICKVVNRHEALVKEYRKRKEQNMDIPKGHGASS